MRKFEKYNISNRENAPLGISEAFDLFCKKFNYFISRNSTERNLILKQEEELFSSQWRIILSILLQNYENYFSIKFDEGVDEDDIPIITYINGKKDFPPPILDRRKLHDFIMELLLPMNLILYEFAEEKKYLDTVNRSLSDSLNEAVNNLPAKNLELFVQHDLLPVLQRLSMNIDIRTKKKGYYKIIGRSIKPIYNKYAIHYGNKRKFIKEHYDYISSNLRLKSKHLKITSFERYI